jgi:hypothetical protein
MAIDVRHPRRKSSDEQRADARERLDRGEIDQELYKDLLFLIDAEERDDLAGEPPLGIDYGDRSSHSPDHSRWTRGRDFLGALWKSRSRRSTRSASMFGDR